MLQRFGAGEFDVVYAHNDEMALGAVQALETAERLDEAARSSASTARTRRSRRSQKGEIAATFTYDNAGKQACESAQELLSGEEIDPLWVLETNQIDATNAAEWIGKGF